MAAISRLMSNCIIQITGSFYELQYEFQFSNQSLPNWKTHVVNRIIHLICFKTVSTEHLNIPKDINNMYLHYISIANQFISQKYVTNHTHQNHILALVFHAPLSSSNLRPSGSSFSQISLSIFCLISSVK